MAYLAATWRGAATAVCFAFVLVTQRGTAQVPPPACRAADFLALTRALAHDSMEGRAPGTVGAARAAALLAHEFRAAGLTELRAAPGFLQNVPLRTTSLHALDLSVTTAWGERVDLQHRVEVTGYSERASARLRAESELVFAGFGIDAPEAGWRDYAGVDVAGKLVVVLAGVPDTSRVRLAADGPWAEERYKLDLARARGALGVIFVLPRGSARFGSLQRLGDVTVPGWLEGLALVAWIPAEVAERVLFGSAQRAELAATEPREVRRAGLIRATVAVEQSARGFAAANVVGMLQVPGATETVILSAHYDHLGVGEPDERGDSIYNGALDNASGSAALVCLARSLAAERASLRRNVLVLATTAEEVGHLGARWYAARSLVPARTVAVALNVDGINVIRPLEDVVAYGVHATDAEPALRALLASAGLTLTSFGFVRRMAFAFDTDEFGAAGIAGFTLGRGARFRGMSAQESFARSRDWNARYHRPSDEVTDDWDAEAIEQHLAVLRLVAAWYGGGSPRAMLAPDAPYSSLLDARRVP